MRYVSFLEESRFLNDIAHPEPEIEIPSMGRRRRTMKNLPGPFVDPQSQIAYMVAGGSEGPTFPLNQLEDSSSAALSQTEALSEPNLGAFLEEAVDGFKNKYSDQPSKGTIFTVVAPSASSSQLTVDAGTPSTSSSYEEQHWQ